MTVLMLGTQLELGHYRAESIQAHGIHVIFPENKQAAVAAIRSGGYDTVILSYTLDDQTARELVGIVKQCCSGCPLIAITNQRWDDLEFNADETILDTDPPQALIDALFRVEKRLQSKEPWSQIRRIK